MPSAPQVCVRAVTCSPAAYFYTELVLDIPDDQAPQRVVR